MIYFSGNEKAFAAGADIKEMQNNTYSSNQKGGFLQEWEDVSNCGKPIIAAVNGFAVRVFIYFLQITFFMIGCKRVRCIIRWLATAAAHGTSSSKVPFPRIGPPETPETMRPIHAEASLSQNTLISLYTYLK